MMIWEEDLKLGKKAEHEFASILIMSGKVTGWEEPGGKFSDYDMKLKSEKGDFTVEVKNDNVRPNTKRVGIEYECKGVPSGIAVSKADYYVYKLGDDFRMTPRSRLIHLLLTSETKQERQGGDDGTAKLWIIPEGEFYSIAKKIGRD